MIIHIIHRVVSPENFLCPPASRILVDKHPKKSVKTTQTNLITVDVCTFFPVLYKIQIFNKMTPSRTRISKARKVAKKWTGIFISTSLSYQTFERKFGKGRGIYPSTFIYRSLITITILP